MPRDLSDEGTDVTFETAVHHHLDRIAGGIDLSEHFKGAGITSWVDIAPDGTLVHRSA